MARTLSVRLWGMVLRISAAISALQNQTDRVFLGLGVLAHLSISLLGAGSLAVRVTSADDPGAALFEPSVLLFLLAGASTALLLLHMARSMPVTQPDSENTHHFHCDSAYAATPMGPAGPAFDGLLDSVGHELRTPLNAIIGFSELMQRELLGPLGSPRYREYVRHIRDSGLALLKAAEDTMALTALLANPTRVRSEPVDLDVLLDEACTNSEAGKRGIPIVRGARCSVKIQGEPAALRQSLTNLLTAAVSRAPERRPISIATHVGAGALRLSVSFADSDARGPATRPSLAVARMLFELQGISLVERQSRDGGWRLMVMLPVAAGTPSTNARAIRTTMAMRSLVT